MGKLSDLLREVAGATDRLEQCQRDGVTDPLRIADAMLGRAPTRREPDQWWELFELDERPSNREQLRGAWRRWQARHHPDRGGSAATFRAMRRLFEQLVDTLPESG